MKSAEDPRIAATRSRALEVALDILEKDGVLAITYASLSKVTGISRSTLYRHWPAIEELRNDTFKVAATPSKIAPKTNGPLRTDLLWMLGILVNALSETAWSKVAPQIVAAAATDNEARAVINNFMNDRIHSVKRIFIAADERGELLPDAPIDNLVEMAIAVPYFRKFIAGLPLDREWLESHVDTICKIASTPDGSE